MPQTVDDEIAQYIEGLSRQKTFSEIRNALIEQFGKRRAWSRSRIVRYWNEKHPKGKEPISRLDRDDEIREFVEDRLGRLTLDEIVSECRSRFGVSRTPGRSSLHRHWKKIRA